MDQKHKLCKNIQEKSLPSLIPFGLVVSETLENFIDGCKVIIKGHVRLGKLKMFFVVLQILIFQVN
jgi:hypothetical protein